MSVCNRVQVTKNDQHFIRLMSTMEERKASTQTNILKFIALCDILQTFKSGHQIAILVIEAFRAVWFVPFVLVVLPYPAIRLANTLNQLFGDTMVIGMPPRPAPLMTKMPVKKNHSRASRVTVFPSEQSACARAGESIASGLCTCSSCFSPRRPQYCSRGQRCRMKNISPVLGKALGGKKSARGCLICAHRCLSCARACFIAHARFMAVFYAHINLVRFLF